MEENNIELVAVDIKVLIQLTLTGELLFLGEGDFSGDGIMTEESGSEGPGISAVLPGLCVRRWDVSTLTRLVVNWHSLHLNSNLDNEELGCSFLVGDPTAIDYYLLYTAKEKRKAKFALPGFLKVNLTKAAYSCDVLALGGVGGGSGLNKSAYRGFFGPGETFSTLSTNSSFPSSINTI